MAPPPQVVALAERALGKTALRDEPRQQLIGLEQLFELFSLRANLHGVTEPMLDAIVDLLLLPPPAANNSPLEEEEEEEEE